MGINIPRYQESFGALLRVYAFLRCSLPRGRDGFICCAKNGVTRGANEETSADAEAGLRAISIKQAQDPKQIHAGNSDYAWLGCVGRR